MINNNKLGAFFSVLFIGLISVNAASAQVKKLYSANVHGESLTASTQPPITNFQKYLGAVSAEDKYFFLKKANDNICMKRAHANTGSMQFNPTIEEKNWQNLETTANQTQMMVSYYSYAIHDIRYCAYSSTTVNNICNQGERPIFGSEIESISKRMLGKKKATLESFKSETGEYLFNYSTSQISPFETVSTFKDTYKHVCEMAGGRYEFLNYATIKEPESNPVDYFGPAASYDEAVAFNCCVPQVYTYYPSLY